MTVGKMWSEQTLTPKGDFILHLVPNFRFGCMTQSQVFGFSCDEQFNKCERMCELRIDLLHNRHTLTLHQHQPGEFYYYL